MPGTPLLASALESTRRLQVEFHPDKSGQIRYKLSEGKMASAPPKVLISYSHDSSEHEERVLTFTDRLRGDGIDCIIDQYVLVPEEGWLLWMERQIEDSDFVLM